MPNLPLCCYLGDSLMSSEYHLHWVHRVPLGLGKGCSRPACGLKEVIHLLPGLFNIITQTLAINSAKVHHTLPLINLSVMTGGEFYNFLCRLLLQAGCMFSDPPFHQHWQKHTSILCGQLKGQWLNSRQHQEMEGKTSSKKHLFKSEYGGGGG